MRTINRLITLAAGTSLMATSLTGREFTDNQGRKVEGKITAFVAGNVSLKREADGQVFQFPIKMLSVADQKYVTEWILSNKKFEFDIKSKQTKKSSKKRESGPEEITQEEWIYAIELKNISGYACPDAQVDYWLFTREDLGGGAGKRRLANRGSAKISGVGNLRSANLTTSPVVLIKSKLKPGYVFEDGGRSRASDRLGGFALRVKANGREIFAYETDKGLLAASGSSSREVQR